MCILECSGLYPVQLVLPVLSCFCSVYIYCALYIVLSVCELKELTLTVARCDSVKAREGQI